MDSKIAGDVVLAMPEMVDARNLELSHALLRMQGLPLTRVLALPLEASSESSRIERNSASSWAQVDDDCPAPHPGRLFYGLRHEG